MANERFALLIIDSVMELFRSGHIHHNTETTCVLHSTPHALHATAHIHQS
jgi:hypothetical protein